MTDLLDLPAARLRAEEMKRSDHPEALLAGAWMEALCDELERLRKLRAFEGDVFNAWADLCPFLTVRKEPAAHGPVAALRLATQRLEQEFRRLALTPPPMVPRFPSSRPEMPLASSKGSPAEE